MPEAAVWVFAAEQRLFRPLSMPYSGTRRASHCRAARPGLAPPPPRFRRFGVGVAGECSAARIAGRSIVAFSTGGGNGDYALVLSRRRTSG